MKKDDLVTVETYTHPVLNYGDICSVRLVHDTHVEVIRGEDARHTTIGKALVRVVKE